RNHLQIAKIIYNAKIDFDDLGVEFSDAWGAWLKRNHISRFVESQYRTIYESSFLRDEANLEFLPFEVSKLYQLARIETVNLLTPEKAKKAILDTIEFIRG